MTEANAICKQHSDPIAAAASELLAGGKLPTPEAFGKLASETIIPEYSAQVSELQDLSPPGELADAFDIWLSDSEATLAEITDDPMTITDPTNFTDVNQEADQVGLSSDCHVGPT